MQNGETHHNFWLRVIRELGGEGVFPQISEASPEIGARFPMMLTKDGMNSISGKIVSQEVIVLDEDELIEAKKAGFSNESLGE